MKQTLIEKNFGYVYAIVAAILFGASTPLAKQLLHEINPVLLAGLFYFGSGIGISIILLVKQLINPANQSIKFSRTDWKWLLIASLVGGIISPVLFTNIGLAFALSASFSMPSIYFVGSLSVGFISYGLSLICFILALRHIGTGRTGAYFSLAPFIGAGLSIILLRESLTWQLIAGGTLMAWGTWLHLTETHTHEHDHEALIHTHSHIHDEHHQHEHKKDDPLGEPHTHSHEHTPQRHSHFHFPDIHHRHKH